MDQQLHKRSQKNSGPKIFKQEQDITQSVQLGKTLETKLSVSTPLKDFGSKKLVQKKLGLKEFVQKLLFEIFWSENNIYFKKKFVRKKF